MFRAGSADFSLNQSTFDAIRGCYRAPPVVTAVILAPMRVLDGLETALRWCEERRRTYAGGDAAVASSVREIVARVQRDGDAALLDLTEAHDGVRPASPLVPRADLDAAAGHIEPDLAAAIRLAAERVEAYYRHQSEGGFLYGESGALLGQLVVPLESVGCYVPGGSAPLFSSVLMTAVPARVAGVERVVVATPPRRDGSVAPAILYAAALVGVETVVRVGGAQGVAALALGTESVPRVDKVVGPGNRYVVEAKRQLFGRVGIESLAGPTETLVVADEGADAGHAVADLLAQAEHVGAEPVLVTTSGRLAREVLARLPGAAADLPTAAAATESLGRGAVVTVADLDEAMEVANAFAPEHLCLLVAEPWALLPRVRNAGGVFLGEHSMEALGDYLVGPSHVMPTGGSARFASSVNLRDFQKVIPLMALNAELVARLGPAGATMARAEGLEAHARAIESRTGRG